MRRLLFFAILCTATAFAADPFVGKWRLNVTNSKLRPDLNIKEQTLTIEPARENAYTTTTDTVLTNGQKRHVGPSTTTIDGREHPARRRFTGESLPNAIATGRRIDEHHIKTTFRVNGTEIQTLEWIASPDGRTLTMLRKGKTLEGKDADEKDLYERQ